MVLITFLIFTPFALSPVLSSLKFFGQTSDCYFYYFCTTEIYTEHKIVR